MKRRISGTTTVHWIATIDEDSGELNDDDAQHRALEEANDVVSAEPFDSPKGVRFTINGTASSVTGLERDVE